MIALEETENALFGFTSARTRQARLEVAAEASQQAADLARLRYREGADSFLTVLDAERRLLEVQDQLAQSATDTALAFVLLYKALGGGWQAVDERLQAAIELASGERQRPWGGESSRRRRYRVLCSALRAAPTIRRTLRSTASIADERLSDSSHRGRRRRLHGARVRR